MRLSSPLDLDGEPDPRNLIPLATPTRQDCDEYKSFSTQKRSHITVALAGIRFTQYPQLVLRGKASTLRLLAHFRIRDPRRIAAGGICRVGMAGRPTTPLTEPDLWASHPALWNEFFMVKQRKLTRDQLHSV